MRRGVCVCVCFTSRPHLGDESECRELGDLPLRLCAHAASVRCQAASHPRNSRP